MDEFSEYNANEPLILIKPPYWMAMGGLFFLFLCFLIYAVFASVPINIAGKGSLNHPSQVTGTVSYTSVSRIRVGMPVEVSFSIADPGLYGRIIGRVSSLSHEHLNIALDKDPDTASGYRWTSHDGPPFEIPLGSDCTFQVTVEYKKPISYLLR
ncbi:MAG: hypothetical protein K2P51_05965 [Rhabdochlamydiaceae bacterium]|nr:hypothetical protein [Rhabdochlamydiaceae bacterium]